MTPEWKEVGCARISVEDLRFLSDLRRGPGIRVSIVGDRAWLCWEPGSEGAHEALVRRIWPLRGVELFTKRAGRWYRLGEHLPVFDVPESGGSSGVPLERIVLPKPITARRPGDVPPDPMRLRLVKDQQGQARPATAVCYRLSSLAAWAECASSAQLAALHGAWTEGPKGAADLAEVLVLGVAGRLPLLPGGLRFWGMEVLIPVGFRTDPDLSESGLRRAVAAGPEDLVVCDWDGFELVSRAVFKPLSRGGIRLARQGMASGRAWGDRRP
jgi:hypothetical protein